MVISSLFFREFIVFMIPGFRRDFLAARPNVPVDASVPLPECDNLLVQLQLIFANLQDSFVKEYDTYPFVSICKDFSGQPMDPCIQMDVDEFYNLLFDRLESIIKGTSGEDLFKRYFAGTLAQQIKSKECSHVSEREESFFALQCEVKGVKDIEESLRKYIEPEVLDGENSYHCSKCDRKVSAVKRMCIKKLPRHLLFHLKRFDFNFQTMRRLKINDQFSFPDVIDMETYTDEFISRVETSDMDVSTSGQYRYQLGGVLVHQGTADSGHYYSFIKARMTATTVDAWFHFNDAMVRPFDVNQLPDSAFGGGGPFVSKNYSAYILVYDRIDRCEDAALKNDKSTPGLPEQFAGLIQKANEQFSWHTRLFSSAFNNHVLTAIDLTKFQRELDANNSLPDAPLDQRRQESFQLALEFFFKIVIRTKDFENGERWLALLMERISGDFKNASDCLKYLLDSRTIFREICLECGLQPVRQSLFKVVLTSLSVLRDKCEGLYFDSGKGLVYRTMDILISILPSIRLYWRTWTEFWYLIASIADLGQIEADFFLDNRIAMYIFDIICGNDFNIINQNGQPIRIGDRKNYPDIAIIAHCLHSVVRLVNFADVVRDYNGDNSGIDQRGLYFLLHQDSNSHRFIIFERLFNQVRDPDIVSRLIELFRSQLDKDFHTELLLIYRSALKSSAEAAVGIFDALQNVVQKLENTHTKENFKEFISILSLMLNSFMDESVPTGFADEGMRVIRRLGSVSVHLYANLFRSYKAWVFPMLTHKSEKAREETEMILEAYFLQTGDPTSTKSSPVMSDDKSKVRIIEKAPSPPKSTSSSPSPKRDIQEFMEWLFVEMSSAVPPIISNINSRSSEVQAPLAYLAKFIKASMNIDSVKEISVRHIAAIVQIIEKLNSAEIENDVSRYMFMTVLEELIAFRPHITVGYLTTMGSAVKLLLHYYQTESSKQSVIDYNRKALPIFYRILLICCRHDSEFATELGQSPAFPWAIGNIFFSPSYEEVTIIMKDIISHISHESQSMRTFLTNEFYHSQLLTPQNVSKFSALAYASALTSKELCDLLECGKMSVFIDDAYKLLKKNSANSHLKNTLHILERLTYRCRANQSYASNPLIIAFNGLLISNSVKFQDTIYSNLLGGMLIHCMNWNYPSDVRRSCCEILVNMSYSGSFLLQEQFIERIKDESKQLFANDNNAREWNLSRKFSPFRGDCDLSAIQVPDIYESVALYCDESTIQKLRPASRAKLFASDYLGFFRFLTVFALALLDTDEVKLIIDIVFYLTRVSLNFEYQVAYELLDYICSHARIVAAAKRSQTIKSAMQDKLNDLSNMVTGTQCTLAGRERGFETLCSVSFKLRQFGLMQSVYDDLVAKFMGDVSRLIDDPARENELSKWAVFYYQGKKIDAVPTFPDFEQLLRKHDISPTLNSQPVKSLEYFEQLCIVPPEWPFKLKEDVSDLDADMVPSNTIELDLDGDYDDVTILDRPFASDPPVVVSSDDETQIVTKPF